MGCGKQKAKHGHPFIRKSLVMHCPCRVRQALACMKCSTETYRVELQLRRLAGFQARLYQLLHLRLHVPRLAVQGGPTPGEGTGWGYGLHGIHNVVKQHKLVRHTTRSMAGQQTKPCNPCACCFQKCLPLPGLPMSRRPVDYI
jgi:hypothetical protein